MEYDKKILQTIVNMFDGGADKNSISGWVFEQGVPFGDVPKYLKESGVTFQKRGENWDFMVSYFKYAEEPTKEGLVEYLESKGFDHKAAKKYQSSYFYPLYEMWKWATSEE